MARFVGIGLLAVLVDVGGFNLVRAVGADDLWARPLCAKAWSTSAATLLAWVGHRWWTFRDRRRPGVSGELAAFALVYSSSALIALGCLAFSHYAMHLHSNTADNVSANVVGLALGTAFRYAACRRWVFNSAGRPDDEISGSESAGREALSGRPSRSSANPTGWSCPDPR